MSSLYFSKKFFNLHIMLFEDCHNYKENFRECKNLAPPPEILTRGSLYILRRKKHIMRREHVEKAESIGKRVTKTIEKITSFTFTGADHKALWDQVSKHTKKSAATNSQTGITAGLGVNTLT